jgi:3-polyprenyl-4-hydroxybenzoate decarboxylase
MNTLPAATWTQLVPRIKTTCPRLTEMDLQECQGRIDLLTAKIQNRHWVSRSDAQRTVLGALAALGLKV